MTFLFYLHSRIHRRRKEMGLRIFSSTLIDSVDQILTHLNLRSQRYMFSGLQNLLFLSFFFFFFKVACVRDNFPPLVQI